VTLVTPDDSRAVAVPATARATLTGLAYWYALYPIHTLIFAGTLRGIARAANR